MRCQNTNDIHRNLQKRQQHRMGMRMCECCVVCTKGAQFSEMEGHFSYRPLSSSYRCWREGKNVEEMFSVLHYFPFFLSFQKYIRHKPAKLLCVCVRGVFVVRTEKKNFRFREEQTNLWWFWIDNECESESDRKGKFFPVFLQTCRRADDVVQSVKRTFAIITKWNWRKT